MSTVAVRDSPSADAIRRSIDANALISRRAHNFSRGSTTSSPSPVTNGEYDRPSQKVGRQMPKYRDKLPQLGGDLFITDGGIETTLIFHEGTDAAALRGIPSAGQRSKAAFASPKRYFRSYAAPRPGDTGVGCSLESATWRASTGFGSDTRLLDGRCWSPPNRDAIAMLLELFRFPVDSSTTIGHKDCCLAGASGRGATATTRPFLMTGR